MSNWLRRAADTREFCPPVPRALDWKAIEAAFLDDLVRPLVAVPQDPEHHPEGDVWTHTRMVAEALLADPRFWTESEGARRVLFAAALLHDMGKMRTTREIEGRIRAPNHAPVGAMLARRLLWLAHVPLEEREAIASLVRWHMAPGHLMERTDATRQIHRIAHTCRIRWLDILTAADARGRSADPAPALEKLSLGFELFREEGCYEAPFPFANDEVRVRYFAGLLESPHAHLHEAPRCTVYVLSGLPGTGKSTWASHHLGALEVVSRDRIRSEIGVRSGENESAVSVVAKEQMRVCLRERRDFVLDSTALNRSLRESALQLFLRYGARVEIHALETAPAELHRRNRDRDAAVPDAAIDHMLDRWDMPDRTEAHRVEIHRV